MIQRIIKLPEQSFFLFGPRQTGKSTLINARYHDGVWRINLLSSESYLQYARNPSLFTRQAIEKIEHAGIATIFVDEVQRVPEILNEVQLLMDRFPQCRFILTGSSARRLKRGGANLLGGRAVERWLFPYVYGELDGRFDLDAALRYGTLPSVYGKEPDTQRDILTAYVHTYLQEEIKAEGIARNVGGFSRFLEVCASQNGELTNYTGLAREAALPVRTVQSYYEILEDTLIGFRLEPWRRSVRKRLSGHPKFYLFDSGVINAICRRLTADLDLTLRGRMFEHFIVAETYRHLHYARSEARAFYWRTNTGAEVDLLLEKHGAFAAAIEIKSSARIEGAHLSGLRSFRSEHSDTPCFVVATVPHAYTIDGVKVLPWQDYLGLLPGLVG